MRASQERFPVSGAEYVAADLFDSPASKLQKFDFVLECYMPQVLSAALREKAIEQIRRFSEYQKSLRSWECRR
jgi:hypothetical protein